MQRHISLFFLPHVISLLPQVSHRPPQVRDPVSGESWDHGSQGLAALWALPFCHHLPVHMMWRTEWWAHTRGPWQLLPSACAGRMQRAASDTTGLSTDLEELPGGGSHGLGLKLGRGLEGTEGHVD